jgi:hypothetical protein
MKEDEMDGPVECMGKKQFKQNFACKTYKQIV